MSCVQRRGKYPFRSFRFTCHLCLANSNIDEFMLMRFVFHPESLRFSGGDPLDGCFVVRASNNGWETKRYSPSKWWYALPKIENQTSPTKQNPGISGLGSSPKWKHVNYPVESELYKLSIAYINTKGKTNVCHVGTLPQPWLKIKIKAHCLKPHQQNGSIRKSHAWLFQMAHASCKVLATLGSSTEAWTKMQNTDLILGGFLRLSCFNPTKKQFKGQVAYHKSPPFLFTQFSCCTILGSWTSLDPTDATGWWSMGLMFAPRNAMKLHQNSRNLSASDFPNFEAG